MSDPPSYDQHLLDRLNALKKSNIQLNPTSKTMVSLDLAKTTQETDLSGRLRSLRNGSASPLAPKPMSASLATSSPHASAEHSHPLADAVDLDDKTLEELLDELGSEDQWSSNPDDPKDIQKLLREAKAALPTDHANTSSLVVPLDDESAQGPQNQGPTSISKDLDMSVFALVGGETSGDKAQSSNLEDEAREVQDIVAKLLDEVNLERQNEPQHEDTKDTKDETEFSLPAVPSKSPDPQATASDAETSKKSLDFESDITARMAALRGIGTTDLLGLPSAPTFKPMDKPVKGIEKKYTDEEVDFWCVICQDDATVECFGCDGDLYCATCWKEGHMGPDVGWEEKRHKWAKYKKPR